MKKIISLLLAIILCVSVMPSAMAAGSGAVLRGDVNGDGKTNSTDALLILRKAVGFNDGECDAYRADLNNDGAVNATDALRVLQIAVGSDNPTGYTKNEALKYYADAFDAVAMKKMNVLYETSYVSKMVNDDDRYDYTEFDEYDDWKVGFENGYSKDAESYIDEFCPDARIDPDLVKSAKITKKDNSTYIVKIVLVSDTADDMDYIPHKTYPYLLNYADCTISGLEDYFVNDATASFPGSEITAIVQNGSLKELTIDIPFEMHMTLEHVYYDEYIDVTETGHVIDVYTFGV